MIYIFNLYFKISGNIASVNYDSYHIFKTVLQGNLKKIDFLIDDIVVLTISKNDIHKSIESALVNEKLLLKNYIYLKNNSKQEISYTYDYIGLKRIKDELELLENIEEIIFKSISEAGVLFINNLITRNKLEGSNNLSLYKNEFIEDLITLIGINSIRGNLEKELNLI